MRIGNVVAKGEGRFEWIIPNFLTRPRRFQSPHFDAEGETWYLRIFPPGIRGNTGISFRLFRIRPFRTSSMNGKSLRCTVGLKRADHCEETIGTESCSGYINPDFIFNKTRRELENEDWLLDDQLTVTLFFGEAHAPRASSRREEREESESAIDQDSRREASKPPKAEAKRKLNSCETRTDALDAKIRKVGRLEDCTCVRAKGDEKLRSDYKKLLESATGSDLLVVVSGREFRAHKNILRVRSPVFDAMFEHETKEKQSGKVVIEDLNPDAFRDFLEYLYTGRVEDLSDENVFGVYAAADKYDVQELKSEALEFMQRTLSVESVFDVFALALRHQEQNLMNRAVDFFKDNLSDIIVTVKWQAFMKENTTAANEILVKALVPKKAK